MIDLRSDTVTQPSPAMRRAMYEAELGDDGYAEDPTVNLLEERAARRFGKEAAVFVASGTMGNLIGLLVGARAGEEVIADAQSHTFISEAAGAAMVGGIQIMPVPTSCGVMTVEEVRAAIRPRRANYPRTAMVLVETTHNRHGGVAWPLADLRDVGGAAHEAGLHVHIDGARVFNAALAIGVAVDEIAATGDTLTFCLSKGLGCPAGSVLCGSAQAMEQARHWRKMLGGAMRQVGVLAAAGVYALDHMVDRLAEDHANARTLAEGLAEMDGVDIDLARVQTNIVTFALTGMSAARFLDECAQRGLRGGSPGGSQIRFVTHVGIASSDIQRAIQIIGDALAA
jgi:threonine aldolase